MGKSYNQVIDNAQVSLAIEQFLIGPYGATYDGAKIDVSSPPSGFVHMGTVVEDSPTVRTSKEKYELRLGIPKLLAYETVMSVGAEISFSIYGNTNFIAQFALGNTALSTISSVTTTTTAVNWIGKATLTYYHLLGVADFLNGSQVVHEFPKVSPATDWEEAFRPDAATSIPLRFNAVGYTTTIDSCSHLVVGKRYYFGPGGACST